MSKNESLNRVIMVDDDSIAIKLYMMLLKNSSWQIETYHSAEEVMSALCEDQLQDIGCIVTDYNMPGKNGLDLINWLHDKDPNIATVLLTGETDKKLVSQAIQSGICDFLEKPVSQSILIKTIERSISATIENRKQQKKISAVKKITDIYERLNSLAQHVDEEQKIPIVETKFFPLQESGGDFVNVFTQNHNELIVLSGDISGHDLTAGFMSTYCQGMIRGMTQNNISISQIAENFNQFLVNKWNKHANHHETTSLATCMIHILPEQKSIKVIRNAIPAPIACFPDEGLTLLGEDNPPLGWFDPLEMNYCEYPYIPNQVIRMWSDGLVDLAEESGYNVCSLAHAILDNNESEKMHDFLKNREDDIFVSQILIPSDDEVSERHEPIFHDSYRGDQIHDIDEIQKTWLNSLQLLFSHIPDDELFNVILCLRESVINALIHGCQSDAQRKCYLSICFVRQTHQLLIQVQDEGKGFQEISANIDNPGHISLGKKIIDSFTVFHEYKKNGSCLFMQFDLNKLSS